MENVFEYQYFLQSMKIMSGSSVELIINMHKVNVNQRRREMKK